MNIVQSLTTIPSNDGNFKSALRNATNGQIEEAVRKMEGVWGNKTRIAACERELRERGKGMMTLDGAIRHCEGKAGCAGCGMGHRQLAGWLKELKKRQWIPAEDPPRDGGYVLLSFENWAVPGIGRYEEDEGGGAFYIGDNDEPCARVGLVVNAWQPLPEPFCGD